MSRQTKRLHGEHKDKDEAQEHNHDVGLSSARSAPSKIFLGNPIISTDSNGRNQKRESQPFEEPDHEYHSKTHSTLMALSGIVNPVL